MIEFEVLGNPCRVLDIYTAAWAAAAGRFATRGTPVWVQAVFRLQRPESTPTQAIRPTTGPEIDKLMRTSLAAMTGVLFADESQVVSMTVSKVYALPDQTPGAVFKVSFGVEKHVG